MDVKLIRPDVTVKLERLLVVILLSRELNTRMLNAVGAIANVVLSVKVIVTLDGGCILLVIVTL